MKTKVNFLDANRNLVKLKVTIENNRLSISGECKGHHGQCKDEIKPSNKPQKELLSIWSKYHLNDMKPGTSKQMEALNSSEFLKFQKKYKLDHYDAAVKFLKSKRLYTVKHNGKLYKYGQGWIKLELPTDIKQTVSSLIKAIESAEDKRKNKKSLILSSELLEDEKNIYDMDDYALIKFIENTINVDEDKATRIGAIVKMFSFSEDDLQDIQIDGTRATIQGTDYIFGNDEEMEEEWEQDLENYIDECILPELKNESLQKYFDREAFISDAKQDGRGYSLNRYDGSEKEIKINETYYYAYQQ